MHENEAKLAAAEVSHREALRAQEEAHAKALTTAEQRHHDQLETLRQFEEQRHQELRKQSRVELEDALARVKHENMSVLEAEREQQRRSADRSLRRSMSSWWPT